METKIMVREPHHDNKVAGKYYLLARDIESTAAVKEKQITYGQAGEKVKEIRESGNVLIVENRKGDRFSVKKVDVVAI